MSAFFPPTPGLQGNYSGTCIGCLRPTDTALAVIGDAEYIVAAVAHVTGCTLSEAQKTAEECWGTDPGTVPDGTVTTYLRLCAACAEATGTQVGLLAEGVNIPAYQQHT